MVELTDLESVLLGKVLGEGLSRTVYEMAFHPGLVVKVETQNGKFFQNVTEYVTWQSVLKTGMEKWFAPCYDISGNGRVLIQARTSKPEDSDFPDKIPACLGDVKRENFGMFEDRLVCHDYGLFLSVLMSNKLVKATW